MANSLDATLASMQPGALFLEEECLRRFAHTNVVGAEHEPRE
jgi:hypothetical protein